VAPEHRGRGIARILVGAAEDRFRRLGGTRADALVLVDNELAIPAWRAYGYRPHPEWARWIKSLSSPVPAPRRFRGRAVSDDRQPAGGASAAATERDLHVALRRGAGWRTRSFASERLNGR